MIGKILENLVSKKLLRRIISTYIIFFALFEMSLILSYLFIPEGFFKGKHPITSNLDWSGGFITIMGRIFFYNLIAIGLILLFNLFSQESRFKSELYIPIGFSALFTLAVIFGIITGSWSFENNTLAPLLIKRITRLFDIRYNSGLIEISSYIFVTAATAISSLYFRSRKTIVKRLRISEYHLNIYERVVLTLGIVFLMIAALIESNRIIS